MAVKARVDNQQEEETMGLEFDSAEEIKAAVSAKRVRLTDVSIDIEGTTLADQRVKFRFKEYDADNNIVGSRTIYKTGTEVAAAYASEGSAVRSNLIAIAFGFAVADGVYPAGTVS